MKAKMCSVAIGTSSVLVALSLSTFNARGNVIFAIGNQQYDNVNIAADTDAWTVTGSIGNTGRLVFFENMIGPDGSAQVTMHGQHGVAFIESFFDSQNSAQNHTGFTSITLVPEPGYAFNAGDFKLDELNGLADGPVTLTAYDQFGNKFSQEFKLDANGQNPFKFSTDSTEDVVKLVISVPTTAALQDYKQVSLDSVRVTPDGGSVLTLLGLGFGGLMMLKRRFND